MTPPRLPDDSKRLVILGSTGSGKSQAGVWHLSKRSFDVMPWFIMDPKRDALINDCGMTEYDLTDKKLPERPGLYVFSPVPGDSADDANVERLLRSVITRAVDTGQGSGLYFDEGYSIPKYSPSFRRILTQGRSLNTPSITLSQRPSWMDVFTFSEADFLQVFRLNFPTDRKKVSEWLPQSVNLKNNLPDYHSHYYDVARDRADVLKPVSDANQIADTIRARLGVSRYKRKRSVV